MRAVSRGGSRSLRATLGGGLVVMLAACGGGSGGSAQGTDAALADQASANEFTKKIRTIRSPVPDTSPTTGTTEPVTTITGRIVSPDFFGMHLAAQTYTGWPSVKFAIQRTWDSWPGVAWIDLNPSSGVFNWTNLDALVNDSTARGVDLVYTFGYVPNWASTNPGGACDGASAGSCFAPQSAAWTNFVTQITNRYKGRIKYWELWNEPNAGNFWKGSNAQLVEMARLAYPIIKNAGATVLTPAPQGTSSANWLDGYFAAGGTPYLDIVAFHAYLYGPPEDLSPLVANLRSLQAKHGLVGKQLWDTEHSWGDSSWPMGADQDQQAAWLARCQVLSFHHGIDRTFWYGWEHFTWGTLFDRNAKQVLKPGVAYGEVYNWMVGAGFSPCQVSGSLYQCKLSRANGYEATIVWSASGASSYTVPTGYTRLRNIDGSTGSVSGGQVLSAGMKPVLVEKL
jgi:hypothetical protein